MLTQKNPKCMNIECKKLWTTDFLYNNFTKTWINDKYKKHQKNILFEETKKINEDDIIDIKNKKIRKKYKDLIHLDNKNFFILVVNYIRDNPEINFNNIENEDYFNPTLRGYIVNIMLTYNTTKNSNFPSSSSFSDTFKEKERKIFYNCPKDNCNGVMSSRWKCTICDTLVCAKCRQIKKTDHICKEEDIKSVDLMKKDSKPCPNCHSIIYKAEGCPQMWCTSCNTGFNWNTLKIIKNETIHNPHYIEWIRNNGLRIEEDFCREVPILIDSKKFIFSRNILSLRDSIEFIIFNYLPDLRIPISNRKVRLKYFMENFEKEKFSIQMMKNEKRRLFNMQEDEILTMFTQTAGDFLIQMVRYKDNDELNKFIEMEKNIFELLEYTNRVLENIYHRNNYIIKKIYRVKSNGNYVYNKYFLENN
uniref:E3 ubiquitin-protein ligase n=1 Tax=Pithovirus LCPAC104 TaxID=2506589 RepID=A0A481Z602_9VIRU|nr:MAG: E3 ubiquitin-protein ligase [Pithovirus LCPAC104]